MCSREEARRMGLCPPPPPLNALPPVVVFKMDRCPSEGDSHVRTGVPRVAGGPR